jgi:hypothetical protein
MAAGVPAMMTITESMTAVIIEADQLAATVRAYGEARFDPKFHAELRMRLLDYERAYKRLNSAMGYTS